MADNYFVVQNGLQVGPLTIDATSGSITTSGNVSITGDLGVSQISKNDSSIGINDTGTGSNVSIIVDGAQQMAVTSTGVAVTKDVVISGNLKVNGTTTTIETNDLVVEDKNIIVGNVATPTDVTADGGGITLKGATDKTLNWVNATDAWTSSENLNLISSKAYEINGASVLNATTLGSSVVNSSLTSVGTLTNLTVTNTITGSVSGNAGTATKLATARTIALTGDVTGSATFDGSGNISIATTSSADSIVLGTDTTGNYVATVAGTANQVTVTGSGSETAAVTLSLPQNIHTGATPTFAGATLTGALTGTAVNAATIGNTGALLTGTLQTAAQPNITSVGTLTGLTVTNTITGNVTGNAGTATKLATSRTISLSGDVTGSVSFDGSGNADIAATIAANSVALGTDTAGNYVASLTNGAFITGANGGSESAALTLAVDATSANTGSKVVARDAAGSFSANVITATLSGTATQVSNALTINNSGTGSASGSTYNGSGAITISHNSIGAAPQAGNASIVTVGNVTTGTWSATDVGVAHGGTGASDAATARTNLGLAIGTDVQAYNATLAAVAGGTYTGDDSITTVGTIGTGTWNATTIATGKGGTGLTTFTSGGALYATSTSALTTGTLPVASGGTGVTSSTGSGSVVLSTSPSLTTPAIGAATGTSLALSGALNATGAATLNSLGVNVDVVIGGNLTVNGTTTTMNTDTITVEDKNITLANVATPTDVTADGGGITVLGATNKTFNWTSAANAWTSSEDINVVTGKGYEVNGTSVLNATTLGSSVVNSSLTSVGTLTNLTVTNTISGSVSGNAGTATKLATARTINGISFDGSASVTVTATATNALTLGTGLTGTSYNGSAAVTAAVSYGTAAGTACQGNDSRLSDARVASDVYAWAKAATKPSYTASEVGLGNVTNESKATMFTNPTLTGTVTLPSITKSGTSGTGDIGSSSNYFGTVYGKATTAQYADLAEYYAADAEYEPGTVVCFGGEAEVTVCDTDHCRKVAGVVSTNPAYLMNGMLEGVKAAVALQGRVPCKVVGPVQKGDMMVAAGNGRARAEADPKIGAVIGKALENFDGAEGVIEVVIGRV